MSLNGKAAIAGIGQTEFSKESGRSELQLACEAVKAAIDDAGLRPSDVDGMVTFTMDSSDEIEIARNVGIGDLMPTPDLAISIRKITREGSTRIAEQAFRIAARRPLQRRSTGIGRRRSCRRLPACIDSPGTCTISRSPAWCRAAAVPG